jgi:hypothetical protein
MLSFSGSLQARTRQLIAAIGRGEPGEQIVKKQQESGADLIVVGKQGSSAWEDFLGGSVAHRVLSWSSSDVLVVPLRRVTGATAPVRVTGNREVLRSSIAGGTS